GSLNQGNFCGFAVQSKLPESTITPPTPAAWPLRYFVVECTVISAPYSNGRNTVGGVSVESMMSGTPASWATSATACTSSTSAFGLPKTSATSAFVFCWMALRHASRSPGSCTKIVSRPSRGNVCLNRFCVPPYNEVDTTTESPAPATFSTLRVVADCPEDSRTAPTPPSNAAILFSTASFVGLVSRE